MKDIRPGIPNASPRALTVMNDTLFFRADDGVTGSELWKSDGSTAGTVLIKDIRSGFRDSIPRYLTNVNGTLFFRADDGISGTELWKSDGSAAGTVLVKDVAPGSAQSFARYFTNVDGTLFFVADDGVNGQELWRSDGTNLGTSLVRDIRPGTAGTSYNLSNVDGTLFFVANDGVNGLELWRSDGTSIGTALVNDIRPGSWGSNPRYLLDVNGTLFFTADDGVHGIEPWILPPPDSAPPTVTNAQFEFETGQFIRITFDEAMAETSFNAADLFVELTSGGATIAASSVVYNADSRTATFGFIAVLPDGNYTATLAGGSVTDSAGNALAAAHQLPFFVFAADANRDRFVNISDFATLAGRFNQPGTFSQGDFNYDGVANIADFSILASRFNQSLPAARAFSRAAPLPSLTTTQNSDTAGAQVLRGEDEDWLASGPRVEIG